MIERIRLRSVCMAADGPRPYLDNLERYLDNPPYYGRSTHQDNVAVRQLCGPTRKFDHERKMWGTSCEDALRNLISSQKWRPVGIERAWYASLMRSAQTHRAMAEADWIAKQQAEAKAAQEEKVAKEAEPRKRASTWLGGVGARPKAVAKVAPVAPVASAPAPEPPRSTQQTNKRDGLEPSEAETAECARLGFADAAIAFSKSLDELGPRGSLSDEGRVLRYCSLAFEHDESVRELTRAERARSWGGREVRWTLPEAASCKYAKQLNAQAAQAAHAAEAEVAR